MARLAQRIVATLAVLLGLTLAAGGCWLALRLGPRGSATFSTGGLSSGQAAVLTPSVLNRLDADYVITARSNPAEATTNVALASPVDADLAVGDQASTRVTGVSVRDGFVLRARAQDSSGAGRALSSADVWRSITSGTGTQTLTVTQENAPESVVVWATDGDIAAITVTVERKAWFVQSLVVACIGLALAGGGALLWRARFGAARSHLAARHRRGITAPDGPGVDREVQS